MDSFTANSLFLVLGLALVFVAVNWLGQSLSRLLTIVKTPDVLKGVILAIIGTSTLEIAITLFAVTGGEKALALGTVLGLCVANLGLVLGLGTILNPFPAEKDIFRREAPAMFISFILLYILCRDLEISRLDGMLLILFFTLFMFMACRGSDFKSVENAITREGKFIQKANWRTALIVMLIAFVAVIWGTDMIFKYGREAASYFKLNGWLTGLVVFAVLIALAKVVMGFFLYRHESNLTASGLVSSNAFNVLLVVGLMALTNPIHLSSSVLRFDIPIIMIFSVILLLTVRVGHTITRKQGLMALLGYLVFVVIVIIKNR